MTLAKPGVLGPDLLPQVGTPLLCEWPCLFKWMWARGFREHIVDLFARLLAGGRSSTAVPDGQEQEGGGSTTLYTTPGAATMPSLLPSIVWAMWEGTILALLLAVGASVSFRYF